MMPPTHPTNPQLRYLNFWLAWSISVLLHGLFLVGLMRASQPQLPHHERLFEVDLRSSTAVPKPRAKALVKQPPARKKSAPLLRTPRPAINPPSWKVPRSRVLPRPAPSKYLALRPDQRPRPQPPATKPPVAVVAPQIAPQAENAAVTPSVVRKSKQGQGTGVGEGKGSGRGAGEGTGSGTGQGAGSGSGKGKGEGKGSGEGKGEGKGSGEGIGSGAGTDEGAGPGSGEGGGGGGGGGGGSSGGGPFGINTGSGTRHIIYVLDISLSMVTRLKRARQEVRDALATLQPEESFNIIAFSNDITVFRNTLVPVTPANVQQANAFLDGLNFEKSTNLEKALRNALAQPDVNLVVVITDGVPTRGQTNWKKLSRLVRSINRNQARIFTIGLVGLDPFGKDRTFEAARLLEKISQDSQGEFKIFPLD